MGKYAIESVFKLIDNITAPLNKIGVKSSVVSRAIKNDFVSTERSLTKFGSSLKTAGKYALGGAMAGLSILATKGVKDALDYGTAMAKVSTLVDTSVVSIDNLSKGLLKIPTSTPITELAEAQYQAISAGVDVGHSVDFVNTALKAAKGGYTETTTAVDGLTTVLNAYGLKADQATKISDQMLTAQNLGKTTFGEMASVIGNVVPIAASLNVGSEELFASIAALTAQGINTSASITGMKAALSNVIKPSSQAVKLAESLGLEFSAASLKSKGLAGFLDEVARATGGNSEQMAHLFGSVEALNAVTVLTGKGNELFKKSLDAMASSAGATQSAYDKMITPQEKIAIVLNRIKNAGIKFGMTFIPVIEQITDKVEALLSGIETLDFSKITAGLSFVFGIISKGIKLLWQMRVVIFSLVAAWGVYKAAMIAAFVVAKIVAFTKTVQGLMVAQKGMNVVQAIFNALLKANPVGLIIVGIAALIAMVILLVKNWDKVVGVLKVAWEWFTRIMRLALDMVTNFNPVILVLKALYSNWGMIVNAFKTDGILGGIKAIGLAIVNTLLRPIIALLELLEKIPGVGVLATGALDKINSLQNSFAINTVGAESVSRASVQPTKPLTQAEQMAYSRSESFENVRIMVGAEEGSHARIAQKPKLANISLAYSGAQ